jgi:hypothetical protein
MKRDKLGRFAPDMPEEWEIDCEFCIDLATGKNDIDEVARINTLYRETRERRAKNVATSP